MRHALVCGLFLALAAPAAAAPPRLVPQASATSGAAPLMITFSVQGDAAGYHWDFGDGATAEGAVVEHRYAKAGIYRAVVTGVSPAGETAVAEVAVTAFRLTMKAPRAARYGRTLRFRGSLYPPLVRAPIVLVRDGVAIGRTATRSGGRFRLAVRAGRAGTYQLRYGRISSRPTPVRIRPVLEASLARSRLVGQSLVVVARVRPAAAGRISVRVWRSGRELRTTARRASVRRPLDTSRAGSYRVRVALVPGRGYARVAKELSATVVQPHLGPGSVGPSVLALERRLSTLRYALPRVDGQYGLDTVEALLAFQKVHGLPWTGRVDGRVWRLLARARTPAARYPGSHIEISKGRQYLLVVRGGRVQTVVHVSTGATGNTPIGRWQVYRKVPGWDWVLWYPMYFLRGFAIHGYPSVPAYPASHGCVRVPMWIAPSLYASNPYGQTIYVYW